jgi:hypothetical protein
MGMSDIVERLRKYGPHDENSAFRICDEAADEIERLREMLGVRDKQNEITRQLWLKAAERALAGDDGGLRNRVGLERMPPAKVIQS